MVTKQHCAFVTFSSREAAERAADGTFNKLIIKGELVCTTCIHVHVVTCGCDMYLGPTTLTKSHLHVLVRNSTKLSSPAHSSNVTIAFCR